MQGISETSVHWGKSSCAASAPRCRFYQVPRRQRIKSRIPFLLTLQSEDSYLGSHRLCGQKRAAQRHPVDGRLAGLLG